ncbi:ABC transporter substrate-binding protein [Natronorubrum sp. JWXQ-INN-674]|uniref:ABC transporter substrate-binding protein n=1 Tax=Natronorubrum halalkaliphilum TaxID=2691917 RepID=A0A6B0VIZ7_9EURY|nr:ABC transporter substrate-binding protein [Natronorubrum halalkaliphilum]MXV61077.1 ABC transporter substrate-binding protein [Natronorubrum halalkaliphilum]
MANEDNNNRDPGKDGNGAVGRRTFLGAAGAGAVATTFAGCLGGEDEALTIGHLAPMDNPLGVGSDRTAQMAVDEINENGGFDGEEAELLTRDTRTEPSEAQDVTEELIQQENVDLLVGTFNSETTQSILDLTAEFDVPFMITGSADPGLITDFVGDDYEEFKNVFRIGPINSDFQSESIADYCEYLSELHGWDEVAFLRDNAAWTEPFGEHVPDLLAERDIDIVLEDALSIEIDDLAPVLSDVNESGADYILRFFAHINAGEMLGIWHEAEYEFGIEGIHVAGMLPVYHAATEGAASYETTSQSGAAGVSPITDRTQPFVQDYAERYEGEDEPPTQAPMYMGFNTYDGISIFGEVVDAIGTTNTRDNLDEFVDEMLEIDFTGVAGQISFYGEDSDYPHDVEEERGDDGTITNFPMTQWTPEGDIECVYPEQHQTAEHQMPHWMQ